MGAHIPPGSPRRTPVVAAAMKTFTSKDNKRRLCIVELLRALLATLLARLGHPDTVAPVAVTATSKTQRLRCF